MPVLLDSRFRIRDRERQLYGRETNRARQKNNRSYTVKSPDSVAQTTRPADLLNLREITLSERQGVNCVIERKQLTLDRHDAHCMYLLYLSQT